MTKKNFPAGFLWGASTASHQVEGDTNNQWSAWETATANSRASGKHSALAKLANWPNIKDQVADPANYISGKGVQHYDRFTEDFDLLQQLNLNSLRFGIEWARIEPAEGEWDQAEIDHYKKYILELRQRGIEPILNIWHWTNPIWFEQRGGFAKRKNLVYFEKFVTKLSQELLSDVGYVLTINEANNYMTFSYLLGSWPPQKHNPVTAMRVYYNLMLAHRICYKVIKADHPNILIGAAHQATANVALNPHNPLLRGLAKLSDYFWDEWFYDRINDSQDFVGMNFYFINYIGMKGLQNPSEPLNDLGWYMEPSAIYKVLMRLSKRYNKPIMITENGVADADDKFRQWWIEETIKALQQARADGADVIGYMHWSLLDNFEWAYGWWPKFGLIAVDRANGMKRTVRSSAKWYAAKIKSLQ